MGITEIYKLVPTSLIVRAHTPPKELGGQAMTQAMSIVAI